MPILRQHLKTTSAIPKEEGDGRTTILNIRFEGDEKVREKCRH